MSAETTEAATTGVPTPTDVGQNPAVQAAHELEPDHSREWHVFSNGVEGRLKPVSPALLDHVRSKVKEPTVPIWHNPEKDRDEPNPSDPSYIEAMGEAEHSRNAAVMDALVMFGVELKNPLPPDDEWIPQLGLLGIEVNPVDKVAKEFAYKRYIAIGAQELTELMQMFSGSQEGVNRQIRSFRRPA